MATFGERKAVWLWRGVLLTGVALGLCLATGFIRPIDWNS
jgi:hypothetical protein